VCQRLECRYWSVLRITLLDCACVLDLGGDKLATVDILLYNGRQRGLLHPIRDDDELSTVYE